MRPMAMLALHSKSCSSAKARLSNLSNQQEDPAIVKIDASLEKGAASCSEATPLAFRRQESCPAAFCAKATAGPPGPPRTSGASPARRRGWDWSAPSDPPRPRSEEHTSELQSLMRISYAVFCLKNKQITKNKSATSPPAIL